MRQYFFERFKQVASLDIDFFLKLEKHLTERFIVLDK